MGLIFKGHNIWQLNTTINTLMKNQHLLMIEISRKEAKSAKDVMLIGSETSHFLKPSP
jgi:hypothetical protein